jgi:hypothetical protein
MKKRKGSILSSACCIVLLFLSGNVFAADASATLGEVTRFRCVKVGDRSATLRWQDPIGADLAAVEITYRSAMGSATSPSPTRVPAGAHTATIALPRNSVMWHFTAKTVDKSGNKSKGIEDWYYVFELPAPIVRQNHFQGSVPGSGTPSGYATYTYDSRTGMVASIVEHDSAGNALSKTDFEYARGDVLWTKQSVLKWVNGAWSLEYHNVPFYKSGGGSMDGALLRINSFSPSGTLNGSHVSNWDSDGVFSGWTQYDGLGKELFHALFVGNASPDYAGLTQFQVTNYDPDGKVSTVDWAIGIGEFDPLGYKVSQLNCNASATPTWREQIVYDDNGNPTQRLLSGGNPLKLYAYDTYKY